MGRKSLGAARQGGYMLFEAMVSMVVFSVGVLGVLGMLAVAVKNNSAAKYRIDACLLANELIGQMWADDRTPATLQANYQGGEGTDGAKYTAWVADIVNGGRLPGVAAGVNAPRVAVTTINGAAPPTTAKSRVVVTLFWQMPGEDAPHNYVAIAQIK